jgi:hypothetical protein
VKVAGQRAITDIKFGPACAAIKEFYILDCAIGVTEGFHDIPSMDSGRCGSGLDEHGQRRNKGQRHSGSPSHR